MFVTIGEESMVNAMILAYCVMFPVSGEMRISARTGWKTGCFINGMV